MDKQTLAREEWEKDFDKRFHPESLRLKVGKFYFKDESEEIKSFIRSLKEKWECSAVENSDWDVIIENLRNEERLRAKGILDKFAEDCPDFNYCGIIKTQIQQQIMGE